MNDIEQRYYNVALTKRNHRLWKNFVNKNFEFDHKDIIDDVHNFLNSDSRNFKTEQPKKIIIGTFMYLQF